MGGGNLQKSQMARAKNQARAQADAAGGGGAAGLKSRQADSGLHAKAMEDRVKLNADREARAKAKADKEASLTKKNAKLAAASGSGLGGDDKEAKKKKAALAAAALAAGAPPAAKPKKEKAPKSPAKEEAAEEAAVEEVAVELNDVSLEDEAAAMEEEAAKKEAAAAELFKEPELTDEQRAEVRKTIAEREIKSKEAAVAAAAEAEANEAAEVAKRVHAAIKGGKLKGLTAAEFDEMLAADGASLLKALLANGKNASIVKALALDSADVRAVALKAGAALAKAAAADGESLFAKLEEVLDSKPTEKVVTGLLGAVGALVGELGADSVGRLLARAKALFASDSLDVAAAATKALAIAFKAAIAKGTVAPTGEPAELLSASLGAVASATTPEEARSAACGLAAAVGALGESALTEQGIVAKLDSAMDTKSKTAPSAREAAVLSVGMLCITLRLKFEPYGIPKLSKLIKLLADKEKKVADAATFSARSLLDGLNTLSVKLVVGALYEGMQVVGGGGRVKIECVNLASLLARNAPRTMGPCLPECIPLVIECLNDSNAKVQGAAEDALPVLCSCVDNAEVANTLKGFLMLALRKPDTTLECIDEVLLTTFCNPMDSTSLAFMMPILIRGIKDANYELIKKATVCCSNLCALIKDSSDIAPFVPLLLPLLEKNLDHSSPQIREASVLAKSKLLEGAGDLVDLGRRPRALAEVISAAVKADAAAAPAEVCSFLAESGAALLEEKLGGVVRVAYFRDAQPQLAEWLCTNLEGVCPGLKRESMEAAAQKAIDTFKTHLSEEAQQILTDSNDKDFALDMQNIILAFAGRVLLRKADIRFQRGHRYGLIGQNGTGKTTLLNRLAAKDINGFPQELRTWYIRHEVLCDDGVDVRSFLKSLAPDEKKDDTYIEAVLDRVEFPEEHKSTFVNSLSGGWKMRMSVAISVLHEPELLLLDEPTNHLDRDAIDWLTNHLLNLKGVTMAVVSHDYDFIDQVCTDITHYDNGGELGKPCKFVYYPMKFSQFQILKPEIAAGLPQADKGVATAAQVYADNKTPSEVSEVASLSEAATSEKGGVMSRKGSMASNMDSVSEGTESAAVMSSTIARVEEMIAQGLIRPFNFPDPGKPEGIRTYRKPILTLKDVQFKYPETDKYILKGMTTQLTLGSRTVIIGGNGSGKSTALKLLIGDLESEEGIGATWRHHALRLSYVAQQSLHHLEEYVTVTPIHYIQERFRQGLDAEVAKLKTIVITDEDKEMMEGAGAVTAVIGRQMRGRNVWYEVNKKGRTKEDSQWYPLSELESAMFKPYVKKLIKNFDQKAQALESGMAIRPITAAEILAHLEDFGIDSMLAHGKIRQMSGGQRQRLVICAAFWSKPHVIALDEPTNYLDNDSVAALTKALKDFKGAVVTVSENEAFVAEISNEKWVVENGTVTVVQLRDAKAR